MFVPSPYRNPTIWTGEVNKYVIQVLQLFSRKMEDQANNLIEGFRFNKETLSEMDEDLMFDPNYSPTYYDVYEGLSMPLKYHQF